MNLDWLRVLVVDARFTCVRREQPRAWMLQVPLMLVTRDGKRKARLLGYEVVETQPHPTMMEKAMPIDRDAWDEMRRNENARRFRMTRQAMMNDIFVAENSSRLKRESFKTLLPATRSAAQAQVARFAKKAFVAQCQLVQPKPSDPDPTRWGLKHAPSGCVVFFHYAGEMADEARALASKALEELEEAVGQWMSDNEGVRG